jgi:hypothetical protein
MKYTNVEPTNYPYTPESTVKSIYESTYGGENMMMWPKVYKEKNIPTKACS